MSENIDLASKLFNETWNLIDKTNRTDAETITMLHKAHTSCYLWREADRPLHNARGEWQVSRVYSILDEGALALQHGKQSLKICLENGIGDFDLAFGYEAIARAYKALGNAAQQKENKRLGIAACDLIADNDDRDYAIGSFADL